MKKTTLFPLTNHPAALIMFLLMITSVTLLTGCGDATKQVYSKIDHQQLSLSNGLMKEKGIAFITPSTVTGQEEEKQAVAFTFADVLEKERPDLRLVTLPETLSAINRAGFAKDYQEMFAEYKDTGIFNRETLAKIGEVTGTSYIAQLKLAGFRQGSSGRFRVFGLRLVETKHARLRLFFQIWDAESGAIAWEAVQELNWAEEKIAEDTIALQTVIAEAAENIASRLP